MYCTLELHVHVTSVDILEHTLAHICTLVHTLEHTLAIIRYKKISKQASLIKTQVHAHVYYTHTHLSQGLHAQ